MAKKYPKFVADSMLGKLARWLRILGYDTVYNPSLSIKELVNICNKTGTMFITRRKVFPDGIYPVSMFNVASDCFEVQLYRVIKQFDLIVDKKIFTRCVKCNARVKSVRKVSVKEKIPEKSFIGYKRYFQCPVCEKVYWAGTHRNNTLRKLEQILSKFNNS